MLVDQLSVLVKIILSEVVVLLALFIIMLILLIWLLLRKIVVVPELNVTADKPEYYRSENVVISGFLKFAGVPVEGKAVALAIQPPTGDAYSLPGVVTDADGNFISTWKVPADAEGGDYVVAAAATGVSSTTTFKLLRRG